MQNFTIPPGRFSERASAIANCVMALATVIGVTVACIALVFSYRQTEAQLKQTQTAVESMEIAMQALQMQMRSPDLSLWTSGDSMMQEGGRVFLKSTVRVTNGGDGPANDLTLSIAGLYSDRPQIRVKPAGPIKHSSDGEAAHVTLGTLGSQDHVEVEIVDSLPAARAAGKGVTIMYEIVVRSAGGVKESDYLALSFLPPSDDNPFGSRLNALAPPPQFGDLEFVSPPNLAEAIEALSPFDSEGSPQEAPVPAF